MNKAVIFDMDGVIAHTNPYHSIAFREFFKKRGLAPTEEEFAQHMYGKSNSYILSHFLKRSIFGEELEKLEFEKESLFREIYKEHIKEIEGFSQFTDNLLQDGFQLGVATSAPRANLDLVMGNLGFEPKMNSILASENVTHHKPDPEVYLKSAKNLNVQPENCVVFEDSFSGVTAAINAGMKVVGVLSSHTKEELPPCYAYIQNFTEINIEKINQLIS